MDQLFLIFIVVAFLAIVLMIEGGYLLWNAYHGAEARRIQRRLQTLSAGGHGSSFLKQRLLSDSPQMERLLLRIPRVQYFDRLLQQSGLSLSVSKFLGITVAAASGGLLAWIFLDLPSWMAPVCVATAAIMPALYMLHARRKRLRAIEEQLPDALELMARALRAGHAFSSAVQMVGSEGPEPIAGEFQIASEEINYGVPTQDALLNLATRVPVTDLRFFVVAVSIQRETGGNLAELLDKLAALIRARFKLLGTIRVLSTEGRLSAWILTLLPFVLLALINLINPKFMSILWTDPAGVTTLWVGMSFMALGIIWMWRIIKIRV